MKAILEFNLPEEKEEFELTQKAGALSSAAWAFSKALRSQLKYGDLDEDAIKIYQQISDLFWEHFQGLIE
jgi:hypothetical protein